MPSCSASSIMPSCSGASISKSHQWTESEEKLLVEKRASMEAQFNNNKAHSVLWGRIVNDMEQFNIRISVKQAIDKWKNLKKRYNEVVDMNRKTGNGKSTCRHYDTFNELFGNKASTKPHFTLDTDKPSDWEIESKANKPQNKVISLDSSKVDCDRIVDETNKIDETVDENVKESKK